MSKKEAKILQFRTAENANKNSSKKSEEPTPKIPLVGPDDIYSQTAKAIDAAGRLDPEVERLGKEFVNTIFLNLEARIDAYRMNALSRNLRNELTDSQLCIEITRVETIISIGSVIKEVLSRSFRNQNLGIFNNTALLSQRLLEITDQEKFLPDGDGQRPRYRSESDETEVMKQIRMNHEYFSSGPLPSYASKYQLTLFCFESIKENSRQIVQVGKSFLLPKSH